MEFEWDKRKSRDNFMKHGVSFEEAELAFFDEFGIESFDASNSKCETRYRLIALSPVRLLFVSYTIREEKIRLISARRASSKEKRFYNEAKR